MRTKRSLEGVARIAILGLLYFSASCFGLGFAFGQSNASPIWPAAGVAMAGLILLGWRAWPAIWLAAFTANALIFHRIHADSPETILWVSAAIACGNTLEAALGRLIWQRWWKRECADGPMRSDACAFQLAATALLMSLVSACFGPTVICATGLMPWFDYQLIWLIWWFGDASGVLLVTPFVLAWARPDPIWRKPVLQKRVLGAFVLLSLTCWGVFARPEGNSLPYLIIVPLVWIASRLGPRALTSALIFLSASATWFTIAGSGPFIRPTQYESLLFLLLFLWVAAISTLTLQAESLRQAHATEDARRNEARFRLAIEYFPGPFVIYNAEKRFVFVNAGAAGANNLPEREWLGHTNEELFDPEFRDQYMPALNRCVEERTPQTLDAEITLPARGKRALLIHFVPLLDQKGQIYQILGLGYDITERKQAEEALRRSEARFETFMNHLPGFAFMKDDQGRYIFLSAQGENVFGRKPGECLGKSDNEIWSVPAPAAAEICRNNDQIVLQTGLPLQTVELLPAQGACRHWLVHKFPISDDAGIPKIVAGVAVDITELKLAQEALWQTEQRLQLVLQATPITVFTKGTDHRYTWVYNPQLGVTTEELIGKTTAEVFGEENAIAASELGEQAIESGIGTRKEMEVVFQGETTWFDVIMAPLRDSQNQIVGIAGVATDITERRAVQEKLEIALKQGEVLRREIHHRVKNNLQIISSLLYLQSINVTDPKSKELLRESQVRARAIGLIHELLYQRNDLTKIDFSDYMRQLIELSFSAYESGPSRPAVVIHADSMALSLDTAIPCGLIVTELISNAIKHAFLDGKKGKIAIDLHYTEDARLRLLFRDNGLGFPELFNPETGRTMGLRLVIDLTRQLDGTVSFRNEEGATVDIIFGDRESNLR